MSPRHSPDGPMEAPAEAAAVVGAAASSSSSRSPSPPVPGVPEQQGAVAAAAGEDEAAAAGRRRSGGGGGRRGSGDGLDAARVPAEHADPPRVGGVPQRHGLVARGGQQARVALRPCGVEDGVLVAGPLRPRQRRAREFGALVSSVAVALAAVLMERRREGHPGVHYRDAALLVGNGEEAAVVVDLETERGGGGVRARFRKRGGESEAREEEGGGGFFFRTERRRKTVCRRNEAFFFSPILPTSLYLRQNAGVAFPPGLLTMSPPPEPSLEEKALRKGRRTTVCEFDLDGIEIFRASGGQRGHREKVELFPTSPSSSLLTWAARQLAIKKASGEARDVAPRGGGRAGHGE